MTGTVEEPIYRNVGAPICNVCGEDMEKDVNWIELFETTTNDEERIKVLDKIDSEHQNKHKLANEGSGWHVIDKEVVVGYETKTKIITPAWTENKLTGYECNSCHQTKEL